jgi:hypothetical protein
MVKQSKAVQILQFANRVDDVEVVEVTRDELRLSLQGVRRLKFKEEYRHHKAEGDLMKRDAIKRRLKKLRLIIKDLERAILMSYDR